MKLVLAVCLALAAPAVAAADPLVDGDFDTDVLGWGTIEPVSFAWDSLDVEGSPTR